MGGKETGGGGGDTVCYCSKLNYGNYNAPALNKPW